MMRKFECKDCRKKFSVEENGQVKCPHCGSDNVDYATLHIPYKYISIVVCGVLATILFVTWQFHQSPVPQSETVQDKVLRDSTEEAKVKEANITYIQVGGTIAPSLSIGKEKEYNKADETYNCRVVVSYPPQQPYKVVVRTRKGEFVAESEDGRFDKLPYSKDDGAYVFSLVDKSSGSLLCEEREFPDFPQMNTVKNPWNENDLQTALMNDEPLVDNPYIANPHKVIVVNKPKGDPSPTESLRDVQNLIHNCNLTFKVEEVEHDKMNKITVAKIMIDYPEDWILESDIY